MPEARGWELATGIIPPEPPSPAAEEIVDWRASAGPPKHFAKAEKAKGHRVSDAPTTCFVGPAPPAHGTCRVLQVDDATFTIARRVPVKNMVVLKDFGLRRRDEISDS
jgi:hypothetical protein